MTSLIEHPRVYLAGPGVFRPNPLAFGRMLKEKCARVGLTGCFPLDNELVGSSPHEKARSIYRANVNLIDSAQAMIADISPFRGPNMDPGTAWEIGYAIAKRLPVFAWTTDFTNLCERTLRAEGQKSGDAIDQQGWSIENFDHVENLMIAVSASGIYQDEDAAISACAAALKRERR
jgi:nucleoside 2-deoxyribosyltransferase